MIKFHSLPGLSYTRTITFFSLRPVSAQGDFSWERATLSWPVHISKVPLYAFKALGRGVQTAAVPQDGFSHVAPAQHLPAAARKAAGMREFMERKVMNRMNKAIWGPEQKEYLYYTTIRTRNTRQNSLWKSLIFTVERKAKGIFR